MTDAYDDIVFMPSPRMPVDDGAGRQESLFDATSAVSPGEGPSEGGQQRSLPPSPDAWSARLETAEQRRQDFSAWLSQRTGYRGDMSSGHMKDSDGSASEGRRCGRMALLQERLASAEAKRAAGLAQLRRRAADVSARREGAAERAAAAAERRATEAAERLEAELAAAEGRRHAMREAERERLRAEHELVLSRLTMSQERAAAGAAEVRSRLEERLRVAASTREERLAARAERAASKVQHARTVGALSRELKQQAVEARRQALDQKLEEARQRREAAAAAAAAASPRRSSATTLPATPDGFRSPPISPCVRLPLTAEEDVLGEPLTLILPPKASPNGTSASAASAAIALLSLTADASDVPADIHLAAAAVRAPAPAAPAADAHSADTAGSGGQHRGHHIHLHHHIHIKHPHHHSHPAPPAAVSKSAPTSASDAALAQAEAEPLERIRRSISSRRLQQGWRDFARSKKTTRALAEAFVAQRVTDLRLPAPPPAAAGTVAREEAAARAAGAVDVPRPRAVGIVVGMASPRRASGGLPGRGGEEEDEEEDEFERFAEALRSPATLKATESLMRRLEQRLAARGAALDSAARLLRRLFPRAPRDAHLERYPPRVLLCAFMIVKHPEVVFSGAGAREAALAAAARELVSRLEALLERILHAPPAPPSPAAAGGSGSTSTVAVPADGATQNGQPPAYLAASPVARGMAELRARRAASAAGAPPSPSSAPSPYMTIGSLLVSLDEAWLAYLDQFVAWKGADAAALESELVRCAAALEASMLRKCRGDPASERVRRSSDLQAVIAQTAHDVSLLRERVARLGGQEGLGRLEAALDAARRAVAVEVAERAANGGGDASASASEVESTDPESPYRPSPLGSPAASPGGPRPASPRAPPRRSAFAFPKPAPRAPCAAAAGGAGAPGAAAGAAKAVPALQLLPVAGVPPSPLSASPRSPSALAAAALSRGSAPALDEALASNAALVLDMLHAREPGGYRLPAADAEAAWARAVAALEQAPSAPSPLPPALDIEELQALGQQDLIRALRSRTAAVAEAAFWDSVAARLAQALAPAAAAESAAPPAGPGAAAGRLAGLVAPLLAEVAAEVAGVVGDPQQAASLRSEFSEAALLHALAAAEAGGDPATALRRCLAALQRLAGLLVAAGAPAREGDALAAHGAMRQQLLAAAAAWGAAQGEVEGGGRALGVALGRALRLLAAQVKVLKVDAANGRLQMLAARLGGDGAVTYLQTKFATIFNLRPAAGASAAAPSTTQATTAAATPPQPPAAALPRTLAWLRRSRGAAAAIEQYIASQGVDLPAAVAAAAAAAAAAPSAASALPAALRSGLRASPGAPSPSSASPSRPAAAVAPVAPVGPAAIPGTAGGDGGWRWAVRCGVAALVAGDAPAVGGALGETLLWDGERLHGAQNQFQQLLVVTAGMLLVTQLRGAAAAAARAAGSSPDNSSASAAAAAAWGPAARTAAARRLLVVVADPGMRLPDLTAELAALAGVAGDAAAEERLRGAFMNLIDPTSGAFRSLSNALAAATLLHVALGGVGGGTTQGSVAGAAAAALLGRVGASGLAAEVAALGEQLAALCGVNEAVHGAVYEELHGQLLEEEEREARAPAQAVQAQVSDAVGVPARREQEVKADEEEEEEEEERLQEGDEI